jgi:hypothetical protein
VTGLVQWSSFTSGYNAREVSGTRGTNGQFSLRDRDFRAYHPKLPWRFCLIDRYMLIPQGPNHLVGSYASRGCSDHAHVELFVSALTPGRRNDLVILVDSSCLDSSYLRVCDRRGPSRRMS